MMMWRALKPETAAAVLRHYLDKRDHAAPVAAKQAAPLADTTAKPAAPAKIVPEAGE